MKVRSSSNQKELSQTIDVTVYDYFVNTIKVRTFNIDKQWIGMDGQVTD